MIRIFTQVDAIVSLVGGGITEIADGTINYHAGQTPPSGADIDAVHRSMPENVRQSIQAYKT